MSEKENGKSKNVKDIAFKGVIYGHNTDNIKFTGTQPCMAEIFTDPVKSGLFCKERCSQYLNTLFYSLTIFGICSHT